MAQSKSNGARKGNQSSSRTQSKGHSQKGRQQSQSGGSSTQAGGNQAQPMQAGSQKPQN